MANDRSGCGSFIDWSFAPYLPPKSPLFHGAGSSLSADSSGSGSFLSKWPALGSGSTRRHHQRTPSTSFLPQTPAWIDDLLDDTADVPPMKGLHRRSSSDSVAFLDAPLQYDRIDNTAEEEDISKLSKYKGRFDEEQLRFKFAGIGPIQKPASSYVNASNHNALASERRSVLETSCMPADQPYSHQNREHTVRSAPKEGEQSPVAQGESLSSFDPSDPSLDPKHAKRILANRQSAQRSRVRKLQYISELETSASILQEEVSLLSPQVACLDHHRVILNVDNSNMKQRLAALAHEKLFKDAQNVVLNKEVQRLTQIFQQQQRRQLQQHPLNNASSQQQLNQHLPTHQQADARDHDVHFSNAAKCIDALFKNSEPELPRSNIPPRLPLVKPIAPPSPSCSTGEKGKGLMNMSGTSFQHSVHNQ